MKKSIDSLDTPLDKRVDSVDPLVTTTSILETKTSGEKGYSREWLLAHEKEEPLLSSNPGRFVLFPVQYRKIWDMYKKHEASFWTAEEMDLSQDANEWKEISPALRHILSHVLAWFVGGDGIINENIAVRLFQDVQNAEARCFYGFQLAMENIHSEAYSLLLDTYITDKVEKLTMLQAIETIPAVQKKAAWGLSWCKGKGSFAERLAAAAFMEGVAFSASFAIIFFVKKIGKLPGLCFSNELISRDEGLHCNFGVLLYSMLKYKPFASLITDMYRVGVQIEQEFMDVGFMSEEKMTTKCKEEMSALTVPKMKKYTEFAADRLLKSLELEPIYNTANPCDWMDEQALQGKTNFFEKKVGDYQKAGVMSGQRAGNKSSSRAFVTEVEF